VVGWSTVVHVAQAIIDANDPAYPYGRIPADGAPKKLTPFRSFRLAIRNDLGMVTLVLGTAATSPTDPRRHCALSARKLIAGANHTSV
jgi:hypothetical protein